MSLFTSIEGTSVQVQMRDPELDGVDFSIADSTSLTVIDSTGSTIVNSEMTYIAELPDTSPPVSGFYANFDLPTPQNIRVRAQIIKSGATIRKVATITVKDW